MLRGLLTRGRQLEPNPVFLSTFKGAKFLQQHLFPIKITSKIKIFFERCFETVLFFFKVKHTRNALRLSYVGDLKKSVHKISHKGREH